MAQPTALMEKGVAKKKASESRKDVPVRIDTDAVDLARIVAAYRKVAISDYMSQIIRDAAKRDHAKILAALRAKEPESN